MLRKKGICPQLSGVLSGRGFVYEVLSYNILSGTKCPVTSSSSIAYGELQLNLKQVLCFGYNKVVKLHDCKYANTFPFFLCDVMFYVLLKHQ